MKNRTCMVASILALMCLSVEFSCAVPFREKTQVDPETAIIRLEHTKTVEIAEIIEKVYEGGPEVVVKALPNIDSIEISAKAQTMREIRELIAQLEKASAEPVSMVGVIRVGSGGPDPRAFANVIRAIQGLPTHDNTGKAIPVDEFVPGAFGGPMRAFGNGAVIPGGGFLPGGFGKGKP